MIFFYINYLFLIQILCISCACNKKNKIKIKKIDNYVFFNEKNKNYHLPGPLIKKNNYSKQEEDLKKIKCFLDDLKKSSKNDNDNLLYGNDDLNKINNDLSNNLKKLYNKKETTKLITKGKLFIEIGNEYVKLKKIKKAQEFLQTAYDIFKFKKNKKKYQLERVQIFNNMAYNYFNGFQLEMANKMITKAWNIIKETNENYEIKAKVLYKKEFYSQNLNKYNVKYKNDLAKFSKKFLSQNLNKDNVKYKDDLAIALKIIQNNNIQDPLLKQSITNSLKSYTLTKVKKKRKIKNILFLTK